MNRGFNAIHPAVAFIYYIGAAILVMLARHPVFLSAGLVTLISLNIVQDYGRAIRKWWLGYVGVALFFLLLTPLINRHGTHILFYFHGNPIMLEAIIQGVILTLSLLCLLVLFTSYNQVVTPAKFLFLFARFLPQWALLTMLTMRFVPLLRRRLMDIEMVQQTKSLSLKKGSIFQRAKNGMQLLHILLEWALEEAIQTADSMKARGYGIGIRSRYVAYRLYPSDLWLLFFIVSCGALLGFGWWLGDIVLTLSPVLEPFLLSGREWFYFSVFIIYLSVPLVIEGREWWLWRSWKQSM